MKRLIQKVLQGLCMPGAARLPNAFGDGEHENGQIVKLCDAALTAENLLVKQGSDADHVAVTTAATEQPLGIAPNKTDAAEDACTVRLLGKGGSTKLGVAAEALATPLTRLVAAANGRVAALSAVGGTYYVIGRNLTTAAAAGDPVEIDDCQPYPVVVQ